MDHIKADWESSVIDDSLLRMQESSDELSFAAQSLGVYRKVDKGMHTTSIITASPRTRHSERNFEVVQDLTKTSQNTQQRI
jgi:hypothetical protein